MEKKKFTAPTNEKPNSFVDAILTPTAEMHILVGGPYTDQTGEEHRYGHTALRIKTKSSDLTYDFGRYGNITGVFNESGDGILRVWNSFQAYISEENVLGRKTTGFVYAIFDYQAVSVNSFYNSLIKVAKEVKGKNTSSKRVYKLITSYDALTQNCTTLSIDGAKQAVQNIDQNSEKFNRPSEVLTIKERAGLLAKGGASRLFLPANLLQFLNSKHPVKPVKIDYYGKEK